MQARHTFTGAKLGSLAALRTIQRERRLVADRAEIASQMQSRFERWLETSTVVAELDRTSERCLRVARDCRRAS